MADDDASSEWSKEQVLETLRRQADAGRTVSAQVFVHETVPPDTIQGKAEQIVRDAERMASEPMTIGPVSRLARSFSVTGGIEAMARIASSKDVRAILPARVDDILPEPLNREER